MSAGFATGLHIKINIDNDNKNLQLYEWPWKLKVYTTYKTGSMHDDK